MRAYLSLGANLTGLLGSPNESVVAGAEILGRMPGVRLERCSAVYRSEPVGLREQPEFANLVAAVTCEVDPSTLLQLCSRVEDLGGRRRGARWGPRTLDVDILLIDALILANRKLVVPHPELHRRRFVLEPLATLAPDLVHPVFGRSIQSLLDTVDDGSRVEPWDSSGQPAAGTA